MHTDNHYNQTLEAIQAFNTMFPEGTPVSYKMKSGNLVETWITVPAKIKNGIPKVQLQWIGWTEIKNVHVQFRIYDLDLLGVTHNIEPKARPEFHFKTVRPKAWQCSIT